MINEREEFQEWFSTQHWGNEDFKTCLEMAWQACAERKDAVIAIDSVLLKAAKEERDALAAMVERMRGALVSLSDSCIEKDQFGNSTGK